MPHLTRLGPLVLALALLGGTVGSLQTRQALAGGMVRYNSAAYGYSLLAPSPWVRLSRVRWTPGGPPADLTLMTPDHQAALGVIIAPTGSRHYSAAELRTVALRLLYQENGVIGTLPVQQAPLIVHGVVFQTAGAPSFSGAGYIYSSRTSISVWVTQRNNRLYAIAGLVYLGQATEPPPSSGAPTPTPPPDGSSGAAPTTWTVWHGAGSDRTAPAATAPVRSGRPSHHKAAAAPPPLPTDHLRGNTCPDGSDGGFIYRDKNCAGRGELQAISAIVSSFGFTAQTTADRRPAATVGVDGFTAATSATLGVRVEYPAQWTSLSAPNTNLTVRSADQNALVQMTVERSATAALGLPALQSAAAGLIAQVAGGPAPTYQTLQVGGVQYLQALAPQAVITEQDGALVQGQVNVTVASYRHRIYNLRAIALTSLASPSANVNPPAVYPYFSPFTTLARSTQSTGDLLLQQSDLAAQTAWSLFVDPQVPDAG